MIVSTPRAGAWRDLFKDPHLVASQSPQFSCSQSQTRPHLPLRHTLPQPPTTLHEAGREGSQPLPTSQPWFPLLLAQTRVCTHRPPSPLRAGCQCCSRPASPPQNGAGGSSCLPGSREPPNPGPLAHKHLLGCEGLTSSLPHMQAPVQSIVSPHPVAWNPASCASSPRVGQWTFSELPHLQMRMKRSSQMCMKGRTRGRGQGKITGLVWGRRLPLSAPAGTNRGPQPWKHTSQWGQGYKGCSARVSLSSL